MGGMTHLVLAPWSLPPSLLPDLEPFSGLRVVSACIV